MKNSKITRIGITCKSDIKDADTIIEQIVHFFLDNKVEVAIDHRIKKQSNKQPWLKNCLDFSSKTECSLIMVLGGDGTMLRAVRDHYKGCHYFFGINMGHLGFLSEISPDKVEKTLLKILNGKFHVDKRTLLKVCIKGKNGKKKETYALNEAVINQRDEARLIKLPTFVGKRKLITYFSDGLIISTPTGSTAYNLSAGGPLVHPAIEASILAPITPHSFTQKPIVVPANKLIEIGTEESDQRLRLTIDGQESHNLTPGDIIQIQMAKEKVQFLRLSKEYFFSTLRKKLGWGERKAMQ